MHDQVRAEGLLQRGCEGVDQLVRELPDEADRVDEEVGPASDLERACHRVECVEQPVLDPGVRTRERVQEGRLARVRVAGQRDGRQLSSLALPPHRRAAPARALQLPPQCGDPVARQAAVGLDLGLARASRAYAAAEPLQMGPQPAHAREVVLELRELHLQLALGRRRVVGEYVQDDRGAVDHRDAHRLLEVPLLAREELVVDGHQVRAMLPDRSLEVDKLALAEVAVRIGTLPPLDELARHGDTGGAEELPQLGEVGLVRTSGDEESPLARPWVADPLAVPALGAPSISRSVHSHPV